MLLHFWRDDYGQTFDDSDKMEVRMAWKRDDEVDVEFAAESYAEHYHDNRDGWEASWPITFIVAKPNGEVVGKVEVDREARPHFSGRLIKPTPTVEENEG